MPETQRTYLNLRLDTSDDVLSDLDFSTRSPAAHLSQSELDLLNRTVEKCLSDSLELTRLGHISNDRPTLIGKIDQMVAELDSLRETLTAAQRKEQEEQLQKLKSEAPLKASRYQELSPDDLIRLNFIAAREGKTSVSSINSSCNLPYAAYASCIRMRDMGYLDGVDDYYQITPAGKEVLSKLSNETHRKDSAIYSLAIIYVQSAILLCYYL